MAMAVKSDKYVIGCKLPNGMVIRGAGKEFKLNGANSSLIEDPRTGQKASLLHGFGVTEDVPADIWDEFLKTHGKTPAVVNGLVFAQNDMASVKSAAKEREKQKTGLEQADPKKSQTQPDVEV